MNKKFLAGAFLAFSLAFVLAQTANAQNMTSIPGGSQNPGVSQQVPLPASASLPRDVVAVAPDGFRDGAVRPLRRGDNDRLVMDLSAYLETPNNGGMNGFRAIQRENAEDCAESGEIVREAVAIAAESKAIDADLYGLYEDIYKLGKKQNSAFLLSGAATIGGSAALCAIPGAGWLYCLGAGLSGLSNLFQLGAHKKAQKVDRKMRVINVDQSRLQIRGMLLNMRATIYWAKVMQDYCLIIHPNATLGISQPAQVNSSLTYESLPPPRPRH